MWSRNRSLTTPKSGTDANNNNITANKSSSLLNRFTGPPKPKKKSSWMDWGDDWDQPEAEEDPFAAFRTASTTTTANNTSPKKFKQSVLDLTKDVEVSSEEEEWIHPMFKQDKSVILEAEEIDDEARKNEYNS